MRPERIAGLVALWVRLYTRGLPPALARRRIDEIDADLHDHVAHERAHGGGDRRVALGIASRMLRGLPADASWRARRAAAKTTYRLGVASAILTALFLLWLMAAVGIIGVEGDPADLMYLGVLVLGFAAAAAARFRPRGMSRVLTAMALAQGLVCSIALLAGKQHPPISSVPEIVGLNAMFAVLFAGSAALFRHAARDPRQAEEDSPPRER